MRKLLFFSLILVSTLTFSQSPQFLNYQGIARDAVGTVINSGNIGIRFEIWRTSPTGTKVYQEEISATPSTAGVFTTAIGSGSATILGGFSSINWANGPYFITVGIDPTGGTSFTTVGTSQLLSVPYALYAETAGNTQTVNLSGPNVIGTFPNYTITAGSTYSAGAGISISSGSIINTALNQTVNINQSGVANVLGSYPNYTVDVANPNLNYNSGTQVLTLTQGTAVTTATISSTSTSVSIVGAGVSGAYPSYTITPPPATSVTAGNSNITVTGTGPGFTISSVPSLSLSGAQLSISNGNTVTLPTGTTYTNGAFIGLTSGTIISNTAPDQTVIINGGTNVSVNSAYPNFTVNAVPTLSIAGNVVSISGGNSITLPAPPSYLAGSGISISSGSIINTAMNQTVNVTGPSVTGVYPTFNVAAQTTSVTAGNSNITVTGSAPNFTVASSPTLTLAGNNLSISNGNTAILPSYAPGAGLSLSGVSPNFTLSASTSGTNAAWNTLGNVGTIATSNFIGTTDNVPLNFRVNNQKAARIDHLLANAFFGYQAGNANTTGIFNTAFGNQSLLSNTTGSYNAAIGTNALYFNTSGINNTAVGYQPLYSNSTGSNNVANGYQALYANSSGMDNTATGMQALNGNTTGSANSAYGRNSLLQNTTGNYNVAYGAASLQQNINGSYNASFGNSSLGNMTAGSFNTALGYSALNTLTNGNNNTSVGFESGFSNSTGSGNVFLGYHAGYNELGSNKLYIANASANPPLIYGDFSTGYVGLGTNNPGQLLHVLSAAPAYLKVESSSATNQNGIIFKNPTREWNIINFISSSDKLGFYDATASIERFTINGPNGFVGINSPAPTTMLNLTGTNTSTFTSPFSASPETAIRIHNNDNTTNNNFSSLIFSTIASNSANFEAAKIVGVNSNHTAGSIGGDLVFMTRDPANINEHMRILSNGNVGIGTNAPSTDLEVNGFTKLGSTAPAIKVLKLTGFTNATAGNGATILHGLNLAKILSVVVMVEATGTQIIPPTWGYAGYEFRWDLGTTSVNVWTTAGNSGNVLNKPIRILITYEQ